MAIRTDFTINWETSPRIITIASPSVECTMQDLLDTLRWLESQPEAMDNKPLVTASGKEPLGGGTKVGLTVSLLNTKISFEARPGPDWVICNLLGGNLVAFDIDGVTTIEPIEATAFVSISKTSSSSATLQEQDALNYSSYGDVVSIDVLSSNSGTAYPVGNMQYPVNNVQDAILIAEEKGFDILFVVGNLTLGTGDDITDFTLLGQNVHRSELTILDTAVTTNCEFKNFHLEGFLDGGSMVMACELGEVNYVNGYVYSSVLSEAIISLDGNEEALFLDCWSGVAGADTPIIDMGGSGQGLAIRGYEGGLKIVNRTGTDPVSLDFNSGQFIADSTITNGVIYVRGTVGKVTINCNPDLIDTYGVTNPRTIAEATMSYTRP